MKKILQIIIFTVLFAGIGHSQTINTRIIGKVTDTMTGEPMPFVSLLLKGTTIGITSDFNGEFSIQTNKKCDTIIAQFVGYVTIKKPVINNKFQTINFAMKPDIYNLAPVDILPGENPAVVLLRKVLANKDKNNIEMLDYYQYELYNKIEFDLNNFDEKFKNRRMLRAFQFVFENADTSLVNGKVYLPLFLSETVSDICYRKKPKSRKEFIHGTRISGVDNESVGQFMGQMYMEYNVYDNFIKIFDKNLVSPFASFGLTYYKYYLTDSTFIDNQWCYKVMFKPRRKQDPTFTGNFWIHDTTYAIKKVDMQLSGQANVNFMNDMVIIQEFQQQENKYWMLSKDMLIIDFNLLKDSTKGFFGKRTSSYKNYQINKALDDNLYNIPSNVIVDDSANIRPDWYWTGARHDTLNKDEKAIYAMTDSVKKLPVFRTYVDIVNTMLSGYKVWGKIEVGPYNKFLSFNDREGARLAFGMRTSNKFSTKFMPEFLVAYGTTDQEFKYQTGFIYMFDKNPRHTFSFAYKNDIEQLGLSENAFTEANFLTSFLRSSPANKLSKVEQFRLKYEKEWFAGLMNTVVFTQRDLYPTSDTSFVLHYSYQDKFISNLTTSEVMLKTRFAFNEKYYMGEFERSSMGTKYPILQLNYAYGFKNILKGDFEYHRLNFSIEHWFNVGAIGYSKYLIESGKYWGTLPFPLLKMHEGNETYYFDEYAYNLMNYYEFASDQYVSFLYTHHFEGFFLNKFPLLKKLKWREVGWVRGLIGDMNQINRGFMDFPSTLNAVSEPYFEAGVAIENILKVLRVDAVWRLSHLDHMNAALTKKVTPFGIRFCFQILF